MAAVVATIECHRHGQPQQVAQFRWRDAEAAAAEDVREDLHRHLLAQLGREVSTSPRTARRAGVVATFARFERRTGRREFRGGATGSRWTGAARRPTAVLTCGRGCRPVHLPLAAAERIARAGGTHSLDALRRVVAQRLAAA